MANNDAMNDIPVEQDEIEAAASEAAASEAAASAASSAVSAAASPSSFDRHGRLLRTVITTKDFLAGAEAFDYVNGFAKGSVANLGTIAGEIVSVEKKEKEYPAGSGIMLTSYWLHGTFEAVVASTGEVFQAAQAILPRAYGVQVFNAFRDSDVRVVTLGCTVGLRLSGRAGIPYEWVVRDHMAQAATKRVSAISALLGELAMPVAGIEAQSVKRIAG